MVAYSKGMPLDTPAPPFSLPATDGQSYSLDSFNDARVLVVVFTCNHCPYAQAVESRLVRLQEDFGPRGAQLVAINPNDDVNYPEDSFDKMVQRARDREFPFPYLRDESQEVARAYNAACTPDFFVFDQARRLRYNGRLDDNWQHADQVKRHDLREVIDCLLADATLSFAPVASMGCSIKWKARA
ncbi:MAG: thioredoxin family protein [Proteobacteria bacterium]|nr:thioredoxin family protein [Pseudomonadota bacterium]